MASLELDQFIDTRNLEALNKLGETICAKKLSAKTLGVSYRTICHWDEKGIIRFSRDNPDANRKYSFVDYIWIKIVSELRSFGVELPIIQKIVKEIYSPLPVKDVFGLIADNDEAKELFNTNLNEAKAKIIKGKNLTEEEKNLNAETRDLIEYIEFIKSGAYKEADFSGIESEISYLHVIVAEIISTKKPVSIIVFKNGDWFPFIKENEHLYSEDFLYKKEYESQVSVSITNLVFNFILEEYQNDFYKEINLLSEFEIKLLHLVAQNNYDKITVLYKSKTKLPLEILNYAYTHDDLMRVFRKKNYREFIITGKDGVEFRMREENPKLKSDLSKGVKVLLTGNSND